MQIPFSNDQKRRTLFRVLSIILGAVSILLFFWDAWMGFYSLLTAALFLMCYCGWIPQLEKLPWLLAVPAIPMIVYDFYRVYLFMLQMFRHGASKYDVWYTLEVLLLALTYHKRGIRLRINIAQYTNLSSSTSYYTKVYFEPIET